MQKFEIEASLDMAVVVPSDFLNAMREAARAEDASAFLKTAEEMHPQDDDEFILMILTNGLKRKIRESVLELLQGSGIGGTFAPVRLNQKEPT